MTLQEARGLLSTTATSSLVDGSCPASMFTGVLSGVDRAGVDWTTSAGWATLAVVVSLPWEMPWYMLWVLPFAELRGSARMQRAGVVLSAFLLLTLGPSADGCSPTPATANPSDTETGKRHAVEIRKHLC